MIDQGTIVFMAREAGMPSLSLIDIGYLEKFAALVAAAEREQCSNHYLGIMRKAVLEEREACAKVCDGVGYSHEVLEGAELAFDLAAAIRARGKTSAARMCPSTYYECQRGCGDGGCKDFEDAHKRSQA